MLQEKAWAGERECACTHAHMCVPECMRMGIHTRPLPVTFSPSSELFSPHPWQMVEDLTATLGHLVL